MQAMILAAGLGTRMRPLTDHTPKPLLPVAGKPLLAYQMERLIAAGADSILINVSHLAEQIAAFIDAQSWPLPVTLSFEETPLETAGGIQQALAQGTLNRTQPLLLVNGDIWCDYNLQQLPQLHPDDLGHLILTDNPTHNPEGDFILTSQGRVQSKAQSYADGAAHTFSGISLLNPALIPESTVSPPPLALGPLLRQAADQGKLSGEYFSGYWLDVGTPERLRQLDAHLTHPLL